MIRKFSRVVCFALASTRVRHVNPLSLNPSRRMSRLSLCNPIRFSFSELPKHQVLAMPALSPTMSEGKIVKWNKNVGDALEEGDILCEVETDKATVGFEVTQRGFLAQKRETDKPIPVGTPLVVVVKKKEEVKSFSAFEFDSSGSPKKEVSNNEESQGQKGENKQTTKAKKQSQLEQVQSTLPKHDKIKMPALSPTMAEGKIVKWNIKQGQEYSQGDSLCDIETDKATVAFEATQKGVLAKILAKENSQMKVGDILGLSVKKKQDAGKFTNYKAAANKEKGKEASAPQKQEQKQEGPQQKKPKQPKEVDDSQKSNQGRVFSSPAAKRLAEQKKINLSNIKGSGPDGRIIQQDIENYKPAQKPTQKEVIKDAKQESEQKKQAPATAPKPKAKKVEFPQNPFEEVQLTNMRKTIAARLTQSKTTIPHYYIKASIQMDKANALRNELNQGQKDHGVKISVNDIIIKAMALALRDYPNVNTQWHGNTVRKFKYADVSVAVATEGGLITPIVYRADTLGLLDIARRTKDIAKRAREGKLDPKEYIGGTTTVSNIGMFGIDSVISVINPPQSTIVGVGKTEKKILFDKNSNNPEKPFRVAQVMEVTVSADHRVVDGAVAAQWLSRIQKYLENPSHMLL